MKEVPVDGESSNDQGHRDYCWSQKSGSKGSIGDLRRCEQNQHRYQELHDLVSSPWRTSKGKEEVTKSGEIRVDRAGMSEAESTVRTGPGVAILC
jgi:hypothetical protein